MAGALNPTEFKAALAHFPRLSDKGRAVARAILVDGATFEEVATRYRVSRQMAHEWASKLYQVFRPQGWVTESVTLPPELMEQVRQMEADARAKWERSLRPPRIVRR